jgi:hypothetical protein
MIGFRRAYAIALACAAIELAAYPVYMTRRVSVDAVFAALLVPGFRFPHGLAVLGRFPSACFGLVNLRFYVATRSRKA